MEGNAIAQGAAAGAADPADEDAAMMLKLALKKVLETIEKSEPELLAQLKALMAEEKKAEASGNSATVTAETIYSSVVGDRATTKRQY